MPREIKMVRKEEGLTIYHWISILAILLSGISLVVAVIVGQGMVMYALAAFVVAVILAYYLLKQAKQKTEAERMAELEQEKEEDKIVAVIVISFLAFGVAIVLSMYNMLAATAVAVTGIAVAAYLLTRKAGPKSDSEYEKLKEDVAEIKKLIKGAEETA